QSKNRIASDVQLLRAPFLRGIIGVDAHILGGQIGGEKSHRLPATPKLHPNVADRLREIAMSLPLVERAGDSVAAYFLTANKNLDARWIDGQAAPSHCRENASPIRIGAGPRGLDEHGMSDCPRHYQGLFPAARLFAEQTD